MTASLVRGGFARSLGLGLLLCLHSFSMSGCFGGGGNTVVGDAGMDADNPFDPNQDGGMADVDGGDAADGGQALGAGLRIEGLAYGYSEPDYVITGKDANVQVWTDGYSSASQALYTTTDGSVRTRVIYDSSTGDLSRIIDEISGHYTIISEYEGRIEWLEYDGNDTFVQGYALLSEGTTFKLGKITGRAVIDGQVQGQFISSTSGTGSYALIPVESVVLEDVVDVTAQMNAMLELGAGSAALSGFEGIGVATSPLISLSRMLRVGGTVLVGLAVGGAVAPAFGAAGVAMILSGHFTNDVANFIENKFMTDEPLAQEWVDLAVSNLRDKDTVGIGEFLQRAADKVNDVLGGGGDGPDSSWMTETNYSDVTTYTDEPSSETDTYSLPTPTSEPPARPVDVTGQAVFQDNTAYTITGTVDENGMVVVTGTGTDNPSLSIDLTGQIDTTDTVNGTYTRDTLYEPDSGSFDGSVADIGDCESVQASGGQGTFTNAHFVGQGGGTTDFYYDAYSIPDAFTARSGTSFTTGGLVAGSGTSTITASENGFVFVSVSAPESGTSWEYSLSCVTNAAVPPLPGL